MTLKDCLPIRVVENYNLPRKQKKSPNIS